MSDDTATKVCDIIARCGRIDRAAVVPEAALADLKVESLAMVEIIFALEDTFKIEIPFEANQQTLRFETVAQVIAAVEDLIARRPGA